jgi:hypothetical protein
VQVRVPSVVQWSLEFGEIGMEDIMLASPAHAVEPQLWQPDDSVPTVGWGCASACAINIVLDHCMIVCHVHLQLVKTVYPLQLAG